MRNEQLHNSTGIPYLSAWITQQLIHFSEKLRKTEGALYYKMGKWSTDLRLKPWPPQDVLLEAWEEDHQDS